MGLWENVKNIMHIPEEDEFDEEELAEEEEETAAFAGFRKHSASEPSSSARKTEPAPRVFQGGKSKTVSYTQSNSQMQVVLVKPDRFEDVTMIADHLNEKKTVVLNLEAANRETSRRIVDFLSGAAYANHGNMRKIANSTFIIVPTDVDVMGEVSLADYEEGNLYL